MKVKAIILTQEGFTSGVGLISNNLILRSHEKLLWVGRDKSHAIIKDFITFVDGLINLGVEVEGWEDIQKQLKKEIK